MRFLPAAACLAAALALPVGGRAEVETDLQPEEIDALLVRLVDKSDIGVRAAALSALLEAQAGALPALVERLFRPNGITAALQQRMVEDYVRRMSAELPPESPVPRRTALAPLLHLLILAPHETYEESWAAVLQTCALLAALDVVDTNQALMEVIRFVSMYDGAYARAIGIVVRSKGDHAIPALVLSRKVQNNTVRAFIATQLARMGKERAPLMAQTDDDQLLADILRAIAEVRDPDGVNVMLSFVNSDRPFVRQAAREALLKYERNAIWAVRKAYEDLTGERADTAWGWQETMERLFAAQDALRLEPLDALLTKGLAAAREERWAEMDEAFAAILGREPQYPRRAEMVPGLLAYGERLLAQGDVLEARRILRLAGYLVPEGDSRAARIRAHLAYLEGLRRRDLGFPDPQPFREAAALDPAYAKLVATRGDLAALAAEPDESPAATGGSAAGGQPAGGVSPARIAVAAGIVLCALAALFLLWSYGRVPGRLFARRATPSGGAAAIANIEAVEKGEARRGMGMRQGKAAGVEAAAASPSPAASSEPDAGAGAAAPPADDPYRKIEIALGRIRKDLPAEMTVDHDHDHDHEKKEGGNG